MSRLERYGIDQEWIRRKSKNLEGIKVPEEKTERLEADTKGIEYYKKLWEKLDPETQAMLRKEISENVSLDDPEVYILAAYKDSDVIDLNDTKRYIAVPKPKTDEVEKKEEPISEYEKNLEELLSSPDDSNQPLIVDKYKLALALREMELEQQRRQKEYAEAKDEFEELCEMIYEDGNLPEAFDKNLLGRATYRTLVEKLIEAEKNEETRDAIMEKDWEKMLDEINS